MCVNYLEDSINNRQEGNKKLSSEMKSLKSQLNQVKEEIKSKQPKKKKTKVRLSTKVSSDLNLRYYQFSKHECLVFLNLERVYTA